VKVRNYHKTYPPLQNEPRERRAAVRKLPSVTVPDLMHATQIPRPFHTKGWVYEEKYDGWRMLAVIG
jgi:hypothetical protein